MVCTHNTQEDCSLIFTAEKLDVPWPSMQDLITPIVEGYDEFGDRARHIIPRDLQDGMLYFIVAGSFVGWS